MDCLEINVQQAILTDLAANAAKSSDASELTAVVDVVSSKVQTIDTSAEVSLDADGTRVYMPASRVRCHIGFGELAMNLPDSHVASTVPVLVDILRDVPLIDFDESLSWEEWALPDQLVSTTVSALLRLCAFHPEHRVTATEAIFTFASRIVDQLQTGNSSSVLTQFAPAFHGLYRALISTSFPWTPSEWMQLAACLNPLFASDTIERLNRLLVDILQHDGVDAEQLQLIQTLLSRYVAHGRPLTGYFIVCCVAEIQWTVLAQAICKPDVPPKTTYLTVDEAEAANLAWLSLLRAPMPREDIEVDAALQEALASGVRMGMQSFTELLLQIEDMESEPAADTYAWETMSESLKLASVCCAASQQIDDDLLARLNLLLSLESPIWDTLVQEAALKSTIVLVHNFHYIAPSMIGHLRRFVTAPLPIFEIEFASETRAPPPLAAAAKCLALCIQIAPGDDLVLSNMYSLLNYIAAASKEIMDSSTSSHLAGISQYLSTSDHGTLHSMEAGLRGMSDEEKRLVGISTIAVVTRLALEFKIEEVTRLTITMLLQRLRFAEPTVEAAVASNLVDLALAAPESSFLDIIRAFSAINRSANPDDPRFSNNMVLAAQTRLAKEMHRRPELATVYLTELLTLFSDKGVAIQNMAATNHHVKTEDMVEQLVSLLLPIDSLLSQDIFDAETIQNLPTELVNLFRNLWFLSTLFQFTSTDEKEGSAMQWQKPALMHIAVKTPPLVSEEAGDALSGEIEYNAVIRQEYAQHVISKHRNILHKYIALRASEIRALSPGYVVFLLAMHDMETMRSSGGRPSSLVTYFLNDSLNKNIGLGACMESIAEKVIRGSLSDLNMQASEQALPAELPQELRRLLVMSTHRVEKARDIANKYLGRLIMSFPSLMCDPPLVVAILEVLTMLSRACEDEFTDEFNPVYEFHSDRANITLQLTDSYKVRNDILAQLQRDARSWLKLALGRAPVELQASLQKYLALSQPTSTTDVADLGASVAEEFGKAIGPGERQLASLASLSLSSWQLDHTKTHISQLVLKSYFLGEAAGVRALSGKDPATVVVSSGEVEDLRARMQDALRGIQEKTTALTFNDLRRLLFRCAALLISKEGCDYGLAYYIVALPFAVFTPSAISAGIDAWTWLIAEKPALEITLMSEICASWDTTIDRERGLFSRALNYDDPLYHSISYAPTNKEDIDRQAALARRLLTPHALILQMLLSRLQAARYRKLGIMRLIQRLILRSARNHRKMSTNALAREARFSFLLFGFELLRGMHLDVYSEHLLREALYTAAFSWFAARPQYSYGGSRVQVDADIKVLSEFLSSLQTDTIRGYSPISSLTAMQAPSRTSSYLTRLKTVNQLLRFLVEDEINRLSVWTNPTHDLKRGTDYVGTMERTMTDPAWVTAIRAAWQIDPAIAIFVTERTRNAAVQQEVVRLVKSNTREALDVPEALRFLLGETSTRRDLKYLLLWAPVTPIVAVTYFQQGARDPLLLQYAHRVLEQHPVDLTFFFVPQIVQALRFDDLGYVARFVFETAKISQLFCHQIIWNMKANCYKDDLGEIEDPMKPALDRMTDLIVNELSGEAKVFYEREFSFFGEVTSISGKLRPFIKKTKPEKKAKIDEEMAKIRVEVGVYLPSNPDGHVVDIDRKSGRPLQSHAKAPFMATFKVRKERIELDEDPEALVEQEGAMAARREYDTWLQAIFKVGDDCRQDVLALQVIAMFKSVYTRLGLTLYLFPYRVTATAPGCGVIDVVPNATSRDEMGRAKVNDLLGFFVAKYGGEDTAAFQRARLNFIQSMAAYSVACYILQIKDRHNGNIMIDGEGHIVHIDFGFLFDIGPGGVKFEPSSFKLTHEMVVLMGGRASQGYALFTALTVKAFLALRAHTDALVATVQLMLGTGLPSFKGEGTIRRLRERFAPGLSERAAAEFMMGVIRNAHENVRSTAYDEFQRIQNGIPYK